MDADKAFELLGLPRTSSEQEIRERFRDLSREKHPDAGGDDRNMAELSAARDVALELVHNRSVQVVAETVGLVLAEQERQASLRQRTEATRADLLRVYVAPHKIARRNAGLLSAGGAALAAVAGWQPLQAA